MGAVLPRRLFMTHGPVGSGAVCLTFDDGPDPILTPRLLDILSTCGVRATFFVIGEKVRATPKLSGAWLQKATTLGGTVTITVTRD